MAIVQRMKSDLTGVEDEPEKFASFIVRRGPGIEKAVVWDVLPEEIGELENAPDIFVVEYRGPGAMNGDEFTVTRKHLTEKVLPKGKSLDELVEEARFLRGRRPGTTIR